MDLIEVAVRNNFVGVRNNLVLFYPHQINQDSSYEEVMQLLVQLIMTDEETMFKQAFAGVAIDYNALTQAQRDTVFALGAKQQIRAQRSVAGGDGSNTGSQPFDWGSIIDGLFDTVNTVIATFGSGGNPAPVPGDQPPPNTQQGTDWTPIITLAKWVLGIAVAGFVIWGAVSIITSFRSGKTASA
jgi:hypothetical protein